MVLRQHLLPQLSMAEDEKAFVCKKDSGYMCINTSHFSFLDCLLYLSAGTSLDGFLLAYGSGDPDERKAWFPYESVRKYSDLDRREVPAYEDYYSRLKGHNTLESERLRYEELLTSGLSKEETLKKMGLKDEPATGRDNYQKMVRIWEREGMTSIKDLLSWYNEQDVGPFLRAVGKLQQFYRGHRINLFKDCFTVAGAARLLLFRTAREEGACFSLMSKDESDLQEKILEQGVTGGPSITFCRYQEEDVTYLHGNDGPKCKAIHGLDANR